MINVENSKLEYFEKFKKKNKVKRYSEDCNDFDLREAIRDDLIKKQRGQCAYCESKITKETCTIEHIHPRDKNNKLECEYSNIVLSCKNNDSCDKFKGQQVWLENYIHPILHNPEEYFTFLPNGEIISENQNALDTITYLHLDNDKLTRRRKDLIFSLASMKDVENISLYFNEHENLIKQYT